ncbi:oligosaccharide biosynthesis protein Alg14 like-domain-containing protein [Gilbertella persicaria]|uniref:UDP-N-acetylglucosamine transferase subunit ALG14 n=1 Tax=Rhizopus stolonifer TaxID=4846 RepID=A0A367KXN9_RHIST|nr:oligosaccharide biosynthesis protein Alg14 like-domain-containing protein [Gilbertella persicaria]KAI8084320.1 oligosaccharide biosynthesis protein Alg14 like-domain-containing protein [Gilbertella persicaria]RCI06983.1 UDP-N-acetylglucosamine transferase subunit [Rhizopus stolonifer]
MIQLLRGLDPKRYRPRTYVVAHHDILSENKAIQLEQDQFDQGDFYVCHIARARKVGQSWRTVPFSVVYAIGTSIQVLIQAWPDVIVGLKKIEIIYIESFARVSSLSLTGKLLYPFVDRFLVQWPELSDRFERAEYKGILV